MTLRTYRAFTMAEALAAVKRDLGADAAILHTRSFRRGGVFGFGRRTVVEVTASEGQDVAAHQAWLAQSGAAQRARNNGGATAGRATAHSPSIASPRIDLLAAIEQHKREAEAGGHARIRVTPGSIVESKPAGAVGAARDDGRAVSRGSLAAAQAVENVGAVVSPHPRSISPDSIAEAEDVKPVQSVAQRFILTRVPDGSSAPPRVVGNRVARANVEAAHSPLLGQIAQPVRMKSAAPAAGQGSAQEEMRAIRQMVGEILRHQAATGSASAAAMPAKLFELYLRLRGQDVLEEIAEQLAKRVQATLAPEEIEDGAAVRSAVRSELIALVPVEPTSLDAVRKDGRPLTIALIGPTGVGKTTTLAKLAATFKLHHGKRVGMITADTYRIAAVEQLRTYANIIAVPLRVALTPQEMLHACQQFRDCDVILIDTAGRSQRDRDKLTELSKFVQAAAPHETHLVLSSTAGDRVLAQEAESFSAVRCDRLIVTKIDEAVSYGPLLSLVRQVGRPLSYITTGQEVPDHLEPASAGRIAELILG